MIRVKARSGHVLTVADDAAADFWVSRGYVRVSEERVVKKAPAKKAAAPKKTDK